MFANRHGYVCIEIVELYGNKFNTYVQKFSQICMQQKLYMYKILILIIWSLSLQINTIPFVY